MPKAFLISNVARFLVLGILLTSCFTYKPFTNVNRGKPMSASAIKAIIKPGSTYRIKLVDSREMMISVKAIDERQISGDLATSRYTGDNFKQATLKPDGVIMFTNVSEIELRQFSLRNTVILLVAGVVVYLVADYGISTSYK